MTGTTVSGAVVGQFHATSLAPLAALGVEKVVIIGHRDWQGWPGTVVLPIVNNATWDELVMTREHYYPFSLLKLYSTLLMMLKKVMNDQFMTSVLNEPLGLVAQWIRHQAGHDLPDDVSAAIALAHSVIDQQQSVSGGSQIPISMNGFRSILHSSLPWWHAVPTTTWLRVGVLPTDEATALQHLELQRCVAMTMLGWHNTTPAIEDSIMSLLRHVLEEDVDERTTLYVRP